MKTKTEHINELIAAAVKAVGEATTIEVRVAQAAQDQSDVEDWAAAGTVLATLLQNIRTGLRIGDPVLIADIDLIEATLIGPDRPSQKLPQKGNRKVGQ